MLLMFVEITAGQDSQYRNVRERLERLNHKLSEIRTLAIRYRNDEALNLINDAYTQYDEALSELNRTPAGLLRARRALLKAVALANRAARILLFKPAAGYLADLENLIKDAELQIHKTNSEDGRYFITKARAYQEQLDHALRDGDYLQAQNYYRISRYFAAKAERIAGEGNMDNGRDAFEDKIRDMYTLLNTLREGEQGEPELNGLMDKVRQYLERAQRFYDQNDPIRALRQLAIGERFLYRAIDLQRSGKADQKTRLQENLYSLKRYIDVVENSLGGDVPAQAVRLLNRAKEIYTEAEKALSEEAYHMARQRMNLAQRLTTKAMRYESGETDPGRENLDQRHDELQRILKLQEQKLREMDNPDLLTLHQEAADLLEEARNDNESNRPLRAYHKTRLCLRLMNRLDRLMRGADEKVIRADETEQKLKHTGDVLSRLRQNDQLTEESRIRLELLQTLYIRARELMLSDKVHLANELAELIQNQLDTILNDSI